MATGNYGYVCKKCGGPSPMGVGYASHVPGSGKASAAVTECACGYSGTAK